MGVIWNPFTSQLWQLLFQSKETFPRLRQPHLALGLIVGQASGLSADYPVPNVSLSHATIRLTTNH